MLERLEVRNLAVIESAEIEPSPGLNVLTGETGAGKSLLVDALSLLLGARAETAMIRPGAEAATVVAWFNGRPYGRRIGKRSTPRIDGEVVTLDELAQAVGEHMALHAQHAAQSLTRPQVHRQRLDALLPGGVLSEYRAAYGHYRTLLEEARRLKEAARERAQKLDLLRFQIAELSEAALSVEEEAELKAERQRLAHLETLRLRLGSALRYLTGEVDALGAVGRAAAELAAAARYDEALAPLAEELAQSEDVLGALAREIEDRLLGLEAEPGRLEAIESRLALYERLKRKYGDTVEEVLAYLENAKKTLDSLEEAEVRLEATETELKRAQARLEAAAAALTRARQEAKARLEAEVGRELTELGMPEARLVVELSPLDAPGPFGLEQVHFALKANPKLPPAPLEKAASGGELSRTMLALLLVTGLEAETVVFDEVDAGIGGEAARAVAERLARLARRHQVIVVTHLPQIAALAHTHFRVTKKDGKAVVERLEGEARVRELARMLSGNYSQEALRHAAQLLAEAESSSVGEV